MAASGSSSFPVEENKPNLPKPNLDENQRNSEEMSALTKSEELLYWLPASGLQVLD